MWLLSESALHRIAEAKDAGFEITAERQADFEARAGNGPRGFTVSGDTAQISVTGILTKEPDLFATLLFGNTSYAEILGALEASSKDPAIKKINMYVDAPGGEVDGLFETIDAIEAAKQQKPFSVLASNAHSAAYAIASAAGVIQAVSRGSGFGSIGTAASFPVGKDIVTLTNTDSPNKRPDVSTEEGRAVMVAQLDEAYGLFVEAIARGRNISAQNIKESYGRGSSFLADEAKRRGMIDSIAPTKLSAVVSQKLITAQGGQQMENEHMDLKTFAAQYPAIFEEAVVSGANQERKRVSAHLKMGETSGDLKTTFEAIRSGVSSFDEEIQAAHFAARMNRADKQNRQDDSDAVDEVLKGAKPADNKDLFKNEVIAEFMALQGGELNA